MLIDAHAGNESFGSRVLEIGGGLFSLVMSIASLAAGIVSWLDTLS